MRSSKQVALLASISSILLLVTVSLSGHRSVEASISTLMQTDTAGQSESKADVRQLEPGVSIERELAGGMEHHYQIKLADGQHVRFQIVKEGMDVVPTLRGSSGEILFTDNFETRERGVEVFSLVAQTSGQYTLIVKPAFKPSRPHLYQVKVDQLPDANEEDRKRFAAQKAFAEGDHLFNQETSEARREALKRLSESLRLWESIGDRGWEARTLHVKGWIHFWLDEYDLALDHFNRALEIRRTIGNRFGEAETLCTIGTVYTYKNEYQKAIEYFDQALIFQQALDERWHLAGTYYEIGKAYSSLYEIEKVLLYYTKSLEHYREAGDKGNEASVLTSLGNQRNSLGDYQQALDDLQNSLALFRTEELRYGEAAALHGLGHVYYNLGELQKAFDCYDRSRLLSHELGDTYSETYGLIGAGSVYISLGYPQKALVYLNEALSLSMKVKDRLSEAGTRRQIGRAYREMGDLPKAMEYLKPVLSLTRETGDLNNEAATLTAIGEIYTAMSDYQKAEEHLSLALSLRRATADRRYEPTPLYLLACVERDRGRLKEALAYVEEAINIIESIRARVAGAELRASYLAAQQGSYELYIDLLMRLHEQSPGAGHDALALRASERARARALLDSLVEAGADIRQGVDPKLLERERSLQKQLNASQERRMRLLSGKHTPEQAEAADREVDSLLAQYQQAQAHIRATSPRYAALTQPQPLDLKGIQSQLDDETLLLVYRLGGKRSFLWAVTPTTVKSYVLAARSEIEKYSNWVRDSLKISNQPQSIAQAEEAIRQLSRLALSPVAGQLARKRLVIVADGALQYIPFAALVAPHSTRPLIFDHEIVNLPSVSALGQQRRELAGRATAPKTLAVIADPVFDLQDERFKTLASGRVESIPQNHTDPLRAVTRSARETGLMGFRRLRFSRQEADRIAGFFPSATYSKLVDFEASRANIFQTDLSQYRILHFATHGLFNNKSPELSGIVLSLYDTERRPQDGFLRAHELYNLRIGADLVVVSACQTALGKEVRGEGLIGLTRGFMYAGAPRIVVSLWNIDDEATAELMKRFYEVMARENLRPAAALRAAQASMSKEPRWSAPYYWAGFILQGEWR